MVVIKVTLKMGNWRPQRYSKIMKLMDFQQSILKTVSLALVLDIIMVKKTRQLKVIIKMVRSLSLKSMRMDN